MSPFSMSLNAVTPIFLMMMLGFVLKKMGIINEQFISQATKFVFRISLPALVFIKIASIDLAEQINVTQAYMMVYSGVGIFISFLLAVGLGKILAKLEEPNEVESNGYFLGTFAQGAFRGNYLIVGYPILLNLYGDSVVVNMALVTLVVIPCFNVFSIIALTPPNEHGTNKKTWMLFNSIIKNPLIIGILLGFFSAYLKISYPLFVNSFISMTADLSTPLALLAIGGFFHFDGLKQTFKHSLVATIYKLLILPMIFTTLAYYLGFRSSDLMIILVLFGGPTAVSSFAMSTEMGGDSVLAGNIIIMTSALCVLSFLVMITFWLSI